MNRIVGDHRGMGLALAAVAAMALGSPTHDMARPVTWPMETPAPKPPVRDTAKHLNRKQRENRNAKRRRAREHAMSAGKRKQHSGWSPFQALVQRMTNGERQYWARDGYPGLRKAEIELLEPYIRRLRRIDALEAA